MSHMKEQAEEKCLSPEELDKLAKDVLADGVVDFDETTKLLGFMTPSVAQSEKYAEFKRLLDRVRADGVITPEESAEVAAALKKLTARRSVPFSVTLRLVLMMFLQMMTFPVWFNTVVPYIRTLPGGEKWVPLCGILMGVGVFASPVVCMLADRFLDSGKVLALCNLGAALALGGAYLTTNATAIAGLLLVVTCLLMPTWSLVSAIAMNHASPASFPYIRVFGTLGWAAAALFSVVAIGCFGIADFDKSPYIFSCGAATCLVACLLSLCLPATPPQASGKKASLGDALGLKALALFKDPELRTMFVILCISMLAFQWYFGYNTMYLDESGFKYLNLTQSLGQVAELGFLVILPFLFKKLGFKWALMVGFGALAFRYGCFSAAALTGCHALDFGGILIHGLIFGAIVVNVQMHIAEKAPDDIRNQAQGLVMILTSGVGDFLSIAVFYPVLSFCSRTTADGHILHNWSVPFLVSFGIALLSMFLLLVFYREGRKTAR